MATKAVAKLAPEWADVEVTILHGGDPVQVDVGRSGFDVLDQAFEEIVGQRGGHGACGRLDSRSCRSWARAGHR